MDSTAGTSWAKSHSADCRRKDADPRSSRRDASPTSSFNGRAMDCDQPALSVTLPGHSPRAEMVLITELPPLLAK